jgi:hypothetical protein
MTMTKKLTIYDIKYLLGASTHYFDRKTLQFFGQTLRDFKVTKLDDGRYELRAVLRQGKNGSVCYEVRDGKRYTMYSEKIYNPITNKLENIAK